MRLKGRELPGFRYWDRIVVFGRRILDGKPGAFLARHEPCSQSPSRTRGIKLLSFISKQTSHVSPNEYLLNRQTNKGYKGVSALILTSLSGAMGYYGGAG